MKKIEKFCNGLGVVVVLLVVALMINRYFWKNAQKQQAAVTIIQPENGWGVVPITPEPNIVVTQEVVANAPGGDGSIVVNDKGASFVMMPVSNRQPVFVPENLLRKK